MHRLLINVFTAMALVVSGGSVAAASSNVAPPRVTHGPCQYTQTPDEPPARRIGLPPDPQRTPSRGTVAVAVPTTQGPLPLRLDRAKAPCTVQSFLHLAGHRFYDRTVCHRLTAYPTLKVLQCGDPTGTGEGGPGYKYKDELPVDLPPAPTTRPARAVSMSADCWPWPTRARTRTAHSSSSSSAIPYSARTTRCSAPSAPKV